MTTSPQFAQLVRACQVRLNITKEFDRCWLIGALTRHTWGSSPEVILANDRQLTAVLVALRMELLDK